MGGNILYPGVVVAALCLVKKKKKKVGKLNYCTMNLLPKKYENAFSFRQPCVELVK